MSPKLLSSTIKLTTSADTLVLFPSCQHLNQDRKLILETTIESVHRMQRTNFSLKFQIYSIPWIWEVLLPRGQSTKPLYKSHLHNLLKSPCPKDEWSKRKVRFSTKVSTTWNLTILKRSLGSNRRIPPRIPATPWLRIPRSLADSQWAHSSLRCTRSPRTDRGSTQLEMETGPISKHKTRSSGLGSHRLIGLYLQLGVSICQRRVMAIWRWRRYWSVLDSSTNSTRTLARKLALISTNSNVRLWRKGSSTLFYCLQLRLAPCLKT